MPRPRTDLKTPTKAARYVRPVQLVKCTILVLSLLGSGGARGVAPPSSEPMKASATSPSRDVPADATAIARLDEAVRFERQTLERQADRHVSSVESLFDRAIWLFSAILTLASAVLIWQFGSSRKELQRSLTGAMREKAEEIVEAEGNALRRRYESLRDQVEASLSYRDRPIAWVTREQDTATPDVLERIYASGFRNVSLVTPQAGRPFDIGAPDLVVLSYDGSDEGFRRLQIIVRAGLELADPFPLLIYTFNHAGAEIRLQQRELELLSPYKWYLPVNFPVQLLSQISSLLRRPNATGPEPA
jgi:hypothetical protein